MIVAIGLDGCLLDYFGFISRYYFDYCKYKGISIKYNPTSDKISEMLGLNLSQYADFMASYGCKYYYLKYLYTDVKEVLDSIKDKTGCTYKIICGRSNNTELNSILSSRYITSEYTLTKQLIQSSRLPINEKNIITGSLQDRFESIVNMKAKYVIDCNPRLIKNIIMDNTDSTESIHKIFIIDNPWNREIKDSELVKRVYSFRELEYRLLTMEEANEKK